MNNIKEKFQIFYNKKELEVEDLYSLPEKNYEIITEKNGNKIIVPREELIGKVLEFMLKHNNKIYIN